MHASLCFVFILSRFIQSVNIQGISEHLIILIRFLATGFKVFLEYFSHSDFQAKVLLGD